MARIIKWRRRSALVFSLLGTFIASNLHAQVIEPRRLRAVAGESRTATWLGTLPPMAAISSTRTTPPLEYPIRVEVRPGEAGVKLVIPPATPPGEYTVEVIGLEPDGRTVSAAIQLTVDAVTVAPAATAARPPVILLNGFQLVCSDTASTLAASMDTFGQLYTLLQADGASVLYFNNCAYGDISIEQLAAQLGTYIASLRYTDGTPVSQVDFV